MRDEEQTMRRRRASFISSDQPPVPIGLLLFVLCCLAIAGAGLELLLARAFWGAPW